MNAWHWSQHSDNKPFAVSRGPSLCECHELGVLSPWHSQCIAAGTNNGWNITFARQRELLYLDVFFFWTQERMFVVISSPHTRLRPGLQYPQHVHYVYIMCNNDCFTKKYARGFVFLFPLFELSMLTALNGFICLIYPWSTGLSGWNRGNRTGLRLPRCQWSNP